MQTAGTVRGLIEQTIDKMPWAQRRMAKRVMARHGDEVVDYVAFGMNEDPCCECCHATLNDETFTGDTVMAFNPDNLLKILDWIMKNLPAILALFFKK